MLTIKIETGNAAFADSNEADELAYILRRIGRRLNIGADVNGAIYDRDGNRVDYCEYEPDKEEE